MRRPVDVALFALALAFVGCAEPPAPAPPRAPAELVARLRSHVKNLLVNGPRCEKQIDSRAAAAEYVRALFERAGYAARLETFGPTSAGYANVVAEPMAGDSAVRLVVGAHYDSVCASPGADDNASGVAVLIELAGALARTPAAARIRFIAFTNEEAPIGRTKHRGSRIAAEASRARGEPLVGMIAFDMLGFYKDEPNSQQSAEGFGTTTPDRANFVSLLANEPSRALGERAVAPFRAATNLPLRLAVASPEDAPDIDRSDHAAYWDAGYAALLLTDTGPFRNANYHRPSDLPDTLDYARMGEVVVGLTAALEALTAPD